MRPAKSFIIWVSVVSFLLTSWSMPVRRVQGGLDLSGEKELGRKILEQIRESFPLVEDGEVIAYVQSVGDRIVRQIGTTHYQYQFFVVNEAVPNAFAIPGGYIFVYRGLIELMSSEAELASIICHELAHIQARHIQRRMEQGKVLTVAALAGMLAGAFLGMKAGGAEASQGLMFGSIAGAQSLELKYSRENEEEADQLGFRYLCATGYDPEAMVSAMQRLARGQFRTNSRVPSYLSTHPGLTERVQCLSAMVEKERSLGTIKIRCDSQGDFPFMQAALLSQYADTQVATDRFQAEARQGSATANYGLGRLYLRQGDFAKAFPYLKEAARQHADSPFVLSTLGSVYYEQGQFKEAQKVLQTALLLNSTTPIAHYRLALILQNLGMQTEALQHLQQIEDFSQSFPEIDHHLGILYGRMNRMGLAHFHLGRYFQQKLEWDAAYFHYEQAKLLLRDSPQRLQETEDELKEVKKKKREADRKSMDKR